MKLIVSFDEVKQILTQAVHTRLNNQSYEVTEVAWEKYDTEVTITLEPLTELVKIAPPPEEEYLE